MQKWLEKMRNKSEIEKRSFALLASAVLTTIIALVYFVSIVFTIDTETQNQATPIEGFKNIFDEIGNVIENNNY